ncbi:hypothetical protein VZT92_027871 [Zoarces viviparus]|uniref:Uncharacterized protein n=1 Tax=Zoarces viviparus TaxID=48416 RepID=A0AAW1DWE6_ZOAVI
MSIGSSFTSSPKLSGTVPELVPEAPPTPSQTGNERSHTLSQNGRDFLQALVKCVADRPEPSASADRIVPQMSPTVTHGFQPSPAVFERHQNGTKRFKRSLNGSGPVGVDFQNVTLSNTLQKLKQTLFKLSPNIRRSNPPAPSISPNAPNCTDATRALMFCSPSPHRKLRIKRQSGVRFAVQRYL